MDFKSRIELTDLTLNQDKGNLKLILRVKSTINKVITLIGLIN